MKPNLNFREILNQRLVLPALSEKGAERLVLIALYGLAQSHAIPKGWTPLAPEEALRRLVEVGAEFVMDGQGRIAAFGISSPWFSDDPVVCELFVDEGFELADVVDAAAFLCKEYGAKRFEVGTRAAANDRHAGLAKLYCREGLTVSSVLLEGKL